MSEFLNRTKITALERSNAEFVSENTELKNEFDKLKAEIASLTAELDRLRGKDLDIIELEDTVLETEERDEINQLREKVAELKRNRATNCTVAFLLGILVTMAVWAITGYQNSAHSYLSFWK